MFIIVKNIKADIKIEDIASLVKPAMNSGLFSKEGTIQTVKIILFLDKDKRVIERHGLVRVANKPAKKIVNQLKKGRLKGAEHQVGEYVIRMRNNDRRTNVAASLNYPNDRRKADRRRKGFKIVTVCEKPGVDANGAVTNLEFCESLCLQCSWKVARRKSSL